MPYSTPACYRPRTRPCLSPATFRLLSGRLPASDRRRKTRAICMLRAGGGLLLSSRRIPCGSRGVL
jgi:hypothetical protein